MRLCLSSYFWNIYGLYFFFIWQLWHYIAFLGKKIMCVGCIRLSHKLSITNCFYKHDNFDFRRDSIMTSCYLHIPSLGSKATIRGYVLQRGVPVPTEKKELRAGCSEDSYPTPVGCMPFTSLCLGFCICTMIVVCPRIRRSKWENWCKILHKD